MDFSELEAFLHLTETLHFGRASNSAHRSPSALSRIVMRLEQQVGKQLVDRSRRSIKLTAEGEAFRVFAKETLVRWEDLRSAVGGHETDLTGDLVLYGSTTAAVAVLPPILERFRRKHPRVTIHLRTGDAESAIERVQSGDADLAVAVCPHSIPTGLHTLLLTTTELEFVAPKIDCPARTAALKKRIDWNAVPLIAAERGVGRKRVEQWFQARGARPNLVARVLGGEAILGMVALGFGIGVVSRLVIDASLAGRQVECLPVKPRLDPFQVVLVARRLSLIVRAFLKVAGESRQVSASPEIQRLGGA